RPAEAQQLTVCGQESRSQHEIARRAGVHTSRSRQAGGDHAAEARVGAERRRLESEKLAVGGERSLDLRQGRATTGRDDQLRGLVVDDALASAQLAHLPRETLAVEAP